MNNMSKPRIIVVDKDDKIIGYKNRTDSGPDDIQRITGLWITNSKGEILIALRALSKKHDPGKWGPAVAGTVDEGETYESNIVKEAEEELGLKNIRPVCGPKFYRETSHKYFVQWFTLVLDAPIESFTLQPSEVMEIKWMNAEALKRAVKEHPDDFLKSMPSSIELFCKEL